MLADFRTILDHDEILLVVFDREGFDKKLFWHFNQLENSYFITWDKNDQAVGNIPDIMFTESMVEKLTGNNRIHIQYFITHKKITIDHPKAPESRTLELRKFCIHDQDSDKKSSLLITKNRRLVGRWPNSVALKIDIYF